MLLMRTAIQGASWIVNADVGGSSSYSCTPESTRATAARIPGAEAIIMREMGHFPMSENPGRFRDYLEPIPIQLIVDTERDHKMIIIQTIW